MIGCSGGYELVDLVGDVTAESDRLRGFRVGSVAGVWAPAADLARDVVRAGDHPDSPRNVPEVQVGVATTSARSEHQQQTVASALALGGRHIDIGQLPEEGHVVLADPAGNEFCVIEPGNNFLAECGFLGALAGDGSPETGYFWSEALGWPLVWDQDEETAIRSPQGGPKVTWGGPPLHRKAGKERVHFDLAPSVDGDQRGEVDRLVSLGATRVDIGQGEVAWVVMADPMATSSAS